jgi:hypothetical protein
MAGRISTSTQGEDLGFIVGNVFLDASGEVVIGGEGRQLRLPGSPFEKAGERLEEGTERQRHGVR